MLTACGCVANPEQTQILTPCQLHDQWARATYAVTVTRVPRRPLAFVDDTETPR